MGKNEWMYENAQWNEEWGENNVGWGSGLADSSSQSEPLSSTDFHYVAPKDPIDWGSNDRNIVAIKEIAERLGVSPQELVDKPYSWQFLTAAVLAWWEGDHWGSKLEFNDHNEYQEERLLGPLARLFNIKRK